MQCAWSVGIAAHAKSCTAGVWNQANLPNLYLENPVDWVLELWIVRQGATPRLCRAILSRFGVRSQDPGLQLRVGGRFARTGGTAEQQHVRVAVRHELLRMPQSSVQQGFSSSTSNFFFPPGPTTSASMYTAVDDYIRMSEMFCSLGIILESVKCVVR